MNLESPGGSGFEAHTHTYSEDEDEEEDARKEGAEEEEGMLEDGPVEERLQEGEERRLDPTQVEHRHEAAKEDHQQLLSAGQEVKKVKESKHHRFPNLHSELFVYFGSSEEAAC